MQQSRLFLPVERTGNKAQVKKERMPCVECYPNGVMNAVTVQMLSLMGLLLVVLVVGDCHLVQLSDILTVQVQDSQKEPIGNGLGLFFYQTGQGQGCNWDPASSYSGLDYLEVVLGRDWQSSRRLSFTAMLLAVIVFVWTMTWSCRVQPRSLRYGFAALTILLLPTLLGTSTCLVHFLSDVCNEYNCQMGRTAYCGIAAGIVYIFLGILILLLDLPAQHIDNDQDTGDNTVQLGTLDQMLGNDKQSKVQTKTNHSTELEDDLSKTSLSGIFARMTILLDNNNRTSSQDSVSVITGDLSLERPNNTNSTRDDPYRVYSSRPPSQQQRRVANV